MPGPLDGVRIVDLTQVVSGPSASMMLGDQGADVIKIENTGAGDVTRQVSTRRNGFTASFVNNNRNKRSIALDLKDERGLKAVKALTREADVFMHNFRPGVIERLGLGEDAVRQERPDIIYASISGFGENGPYAAKPVYDPLVQALSGLTTIQGGSDKARPRLVRTILPDKLTGVMASQSITAALLHRFRTGEGQHVRVSMLDSIVAFLWNSDMGGHTFIGDEIDSETAHSFIDLIYETTTDFISVAVNTDKQWVALTEALGHPEWRDDPRFNTPENRHHHIDERLELTQHVLATDSAAHWLKVLDAHDIPCAPVLRRKEMIAHPQIVENDIIVELEHAHAGPLRQARPAGQFSKSPIEYRRGAPLQGEHTREILTEAGLDPAEIAAMLADGAAMAPNPPSHERAAE
ncbi:MAG: CoA transferase [Alphaproteobacteria bacterium]|nr:CoA transferase [Alphaproteobacteria bacterium]